MPTDRDTNHGFTTMRVRPNPHLPSSRPVQTSSSVYYLSPSSLLIGGTNLPTATMSNFWTREIHSDNEKLPTIEESPSFSIRGHRAKSLPAMLTQQNTIVRQTKTPRHSWTEGTFTTHVKPVDSDRISGLSGKRTDLRPSTSWDKNGRRRVHFTAVSKGEEVSKGIQRYNAAQNVPTAQKNATVTDELVVDDSEGNEKTPIMKVTVSHRNSKSAGDAVKAELESAARVSAATEAWCQRYLGQQRFRKPPQPTSTVPTAPVNKSPATQTANKETQVKPNTQQSGESSTTDAAARKETTRTIEIQDSHVQWQMPTTHINFCDHKKTERIMRWLDEVNVQTKVCDKISGKWTSGDEER
ncbi:uncharacterized protein [Ptychodera flava]|uniref:uncharacterized protein n=1 Tax=Ptychodera flava TaxID=63121 RepID=UPI00396A721D